MEEFNLALARSILASEGFREHHNQPNTFFFNRGAIGIKLDPDGATAQKLYDQGSKTQLIWITNLEDFGVIEPHPFTKSGLGHAIHAIKKGAQILCPKCDAPLRDTSLEVDERGYTLINPENSFQYDTQLNTRYVACLGCTSKVEIIFQDYEKSGAVNWIAGRILE